MLLRGQKHERAVVRWAERWREGEEKRGREERDEGRASECVELLAGQRRCCWLVCRSKCEVGARCGGDGPRFAVPLLLLH